MSADAEVVRVNGFPVAVNAPTAAGWAGFDALDELVDLVQQQLAPRVEQEMRRRREGGGEPDERAIAGDLLDAALAEVIKEWTTAQGRPFPSAEEEFVVKQGVIANMFGLGRLEPLLADERIENIDVVGCDPVMLAHSDGTVHLGERLVPTDEALVRLLQRLATRHGRTERAINSAHPLLNMELPGGARLAAAIEVTDRPAVSIRRHRLREVTLEDLRDRGMVSTAQLALLRSAVRAGKNILVCGRQRAGKTTLLRGLCWEIPAEEHFATIETEFELGLHRFRGRFPGVLPFEAREGNSERFDNGRPSGGIDLARLVWQSLRMHTSRVIVGEVRGEEIIPMLDAMSTGGAGSLSTVHSRGAGNAIERLVSLCLGSNAAWTENFANRVVAESIDLIVHVRMIKTNSGLDRFVDEIISVELGEQGRPARTPLFKPDPARFPTVGHRGVPTGVVPNDVAEYEEQDFDRSWLIASGTDGEWHLPAHAHTMGGGD